MTVLRVDTTIRGKASVSAALADLVIAELLAVRPAESVVHRHLGVNPLPADAWADALTAAPLPDSDRTPQQHAALALAQQLADELRTAGALILTQPLYNWGISQHTKTWIDLVIAAGKPSTPLLAGKPAVLIVTRGGSYAPGAPKEGWDHATDYLRRIIGEVWQADLTLIERELTLVGVNPALDSLAELATQSKQEAEAAAIAAGRALAAR